MQAIILAGGFGTRLQSVVNNVPKPLAPINDRPFLDYLISYINHQNITDICLSVHYMADKITNYFGNKYNYAIEEAPLGTGGAIKYALTKLPKKNEPVLVINGDSFVKFDIKLLYENFKKTNSKITIALRHVEDVSRYGLVSVDSKYITDFDGAKKNSGPGLINAGLYLINPNIFDDFDMQDIFSFEVDFLQKYISTLNPGFVTLEDYFIDIGIPEDYKRACLELPNLINMEENIA